jgi:hypothetical protein
MKIIIMLTEPDAHMLIKLLGQEASAATIVKDLQAALSKDLTAARNKELMG